LFGVDYESFHFETHVLRGLRPPHGQIAYFGPDEFARWLFAQRVHYSVQDALGALGKVFFEGHEPPGVVVRMGHNDDLEFVLWGPLSRGVVFYVETLFPCATVYVVEWQLLEEFVNLFCFK